MGSGRTLGFYDSVSWPWIVVGSTWCLWSRADLGFACFLSGTGTNTKLLEKLTDEAKNVMVTADSVFLNVTNDLQSGRILVKHLEEIFQYEEQFISIYEISKSTIHSGSLGLGHHCSD